jgi:hypothetical protein
MGALKGSRLAVPAAPDLWSSDEEVGELHRVLSGLAQGRHAGPRDDGGLTMRNRCGYIVAS